MEARRAPKIDFEKNGGIELGSLEWVVRMIWGKRRPSDSQK